MNAFPLLACSRLFLFENLFQVILRFVAHSFSVILCAWRALTICTARPEVSSLPWRAPSDSDIMLMHHPQRFHQANAQRGAV